MNVYQFCIIIIIIVNIYSADKHICNNQPEFTDPQSRAARYFFTVTWHRTRFSHLC